MKTKKLELKHYLASYLPYNVKMFANGFKGTLQTLNIDNTTQSGYKIRVSCSDWWENNNIDGKIYKPILHQISDLTKEIEVNGVKVIPIIELAKIEAGEMFSNIIESPIYDESENQITVFYNDECGENTLLIDFDSTSLFTCCRGSWTDSARNQYELFQKLFEMHFDVFGLIESGLAIDINTLMQPK